jgi:flagellar hook protein FlgE
MSFQDGLSGLNAAARNLDVIGNNVANSSTVGAKTSRAEFSDVYANALSGSGTGAVGIGVAVSSIAQQFTQGDISTTQNPMDMAINGRGFFRTSLNGAVQYTRNGQFRMDKDGFIVNAQGANLTGYSADSAGKIQGGAPNPLQISQADISPKSTATTAAQFNLDAGAKVPTATFSSTDPTSYNNSNSMSVYDSLGRQHQVTLYYAKTSANKWAVYGSADGTELPTKPLTNLAFDATGSLTAPAAPFSVTIPVGADAGTSLTFTTNVGTATQFGAPFSTTNITQDGYGSGRLSGFSADTSGVIVGRYTNGQTKALGQVVLANFVNPQGLTPLGNNAWSEGAGSGQPTLGVSGTGTLGPLQSQALENSNVDLTGELVNMITAQRVYQANAQTIKTHDQLLQTIVNLR